MTGTSIDYTHDGATFEGYLARPDGVARGLVVVGHAWGGPGDHEREVCDKLAALGCAAFAYDVYGKGQRASEPEACQALMTPLVADRAMLQARLAASIATAQRETGFGADKTVDIGYCFGGLCALDVARAGMDVAGVVSFHGLFMPADNLAVDKTISAKVLILHGYDDPLAPPEAMTGVMDEMTRAGADWQLIGYGGTAHAFTNKAAAAPEAGMAFNPASDARSWQALLNFLDEVMG